MQSHRTDLGCAARMESKTSGCNSEEGFSSPIYEMSSQENPSYLHSNQDRQQVSTYSLTPWRHFRAAAVSLALLAAVLLMVDISLGVHYHKLTATNLTLEDPEHIKNELVKLQDTYKTADESRKGAEKQLESERSLQTPTSWELKHQKKRSNNYEVQLVKITKDVAALRNYLPMINGGCRHCSPGWILMNSVCYYFPFSVTDGYKTWQQAREYCQMHGGDLAVIDSKDKENATVNHLMNNKDLNNNGGFWIGLKDNREEGTWKWWDGKILVEGYWIDGEPNNNSEDVKDCAILLARTNFFEAWNDVKCNAPLKWICEKAPISLS